MYFWNIPHYRFELGIGERCNMRCPFCMERDGGYKNNGVSKEQLSWFAEYMKYLKDKTQYTVSASVYGGESLLYIDNIIYFAEKIAPFADHMVVVSNGLQVKKYAKELKYIRNLFKDTFQINVSYNFSMQNETRQDNTYDIVRDSIRFLTKELGWYSQSTCVFTPSTLHHINEVFEDWRNLHEECPRHCAKFNYTRADIPWSSVDEELIRSEMTKFRDTRRVYPELQNLFNFNWVGSYRGHRKRDCLFSCVPAALCADGCVYPGYEVIYSNDFTKDLLRFGKAGDDFSVIEKRRFECLHTLSVNPPPECKTCKAPCRMLPWRTVVNDISQYNSLPHPERCIAMKLIGEYLEGERK